MGQEELSNLFIKEELDQEYKGDEKREERGSDFVLKGRSGSLDHLCLHWLFSFVLSGCYELEKNKFLSYFPGA